MTCSPKIAVADGQDPSTTSPIGAVRVTGDAARNNLVAAISDTTGESPIRRKRSTCLDTVDQATLIGDRVDVRRGRPPTRLALCSGGTARLADGLASVLRGAGGRIETGVEIRNASQLARFYLVFFDTSPRLPAKLLGDRIPTRIRRALGRHRYGAAAFKLDLAVHEGIPWTNPAARSAGSLHVCGSAEEVITAERAIYAGRMPERPFVFVAQQWLMDPRRAAGDVKPVYAYAHVPQGYTGDATDAISAQVERFAPGFRERIVAQRVHTPLDIERQNPNNLGGDINGGSMDLRAFIARPRLAVDPYWLGVDGFYLCSSSTPPGGGVHGMCGHLAARAALRRQKIAAVTNG